MRDWQKLDYTNTFREMVDMFNDNSNSSAFIDSMVGTILCNGVLYSGNETVDGMIIQPLQSVELSGVVNSNTEFDNFTLYYRDTNKLVTLNQFPIDLLSYANGKPQFLYIKEDLTYRVSDYMFGAADEILLVRFVINTNSTWNQLYIIGQRAGTPMYNAADEFYEIDGMYVKSPGGLELSQSSGTIKRSGIDFTDKVSPDIYQFYNIATERVPLRYITANNEIDYTKEPTYNVETNKYLTYNTNTSYKTTAEEMIQLIQNMYYGIEGYSNSVSEELHTAIVSGGDLADLTQIVNAYTSYIDNIYVEVDKLYNLLGNSVLNSVRRAALLENKNLVEAHLNQYLKGTAIETEINETQVTAIKNTAAYIINIDLLVCASPLDNALQEIQDGLNAISFEAGTFNPVPAGKFTIQRILWDIYEQTLILQYGDTVYEDFNSAIEGTNLVAYPAPYSKTIYIPLAIMIIKSGVTDINEDSECIIIDRRWIEVDQEMSDYADYVARAKIEKVINQLNQIINGIIAVKKADSLKCTVNGEVVYKDGDYFLNYDNLQNKIAIINNLTTSSYNAKQALSAYQGYILNNAKVNKAGDTMTGTLNTRVVLPSTGSTYDLGSTSKKWKTVYAVNMFATAVGTYSNSSGHSGFSNNGKYLPYSSDNSVYNIQAMAKSSADSSSTWNAIQNKTLVFCW